MSLEAMQCATKVAIRTGTPSFKISGDLLRHHEFLRFP
jgi:hypothetical protein